MDSYQIAYECHRSIELARLGYLFANGLLDADDANAIVYECQPITGWFPLETVSVEELVVREALLVVLNMLDRRTR